MKNQRNAGKGKSRDQRPPVAASSQEGSVESLGGGPAGSDRSDRSGGGTLPSAGTPRPEKGRDAFVSSEVSDKSTVPGKDPRTRS